MFTYTGGGRASSITEVVVAEGVKDLPVEGGCFFFEECGKMMEATLPSTLESMGVQAFRLCGQLPGGRFVKNHGHHDRRGTLSTSAGR